MEDFKSVKKWNKYHEGDLSNHSFLITGGAGFIGSNIVSYLVQHNAGKIKVLDNLSNGHIKNIQEYFDYPGFEFIEGDITNYETCCESVKDIEFISHQAALGSVPRSIENPMQSAEVNILGTLNLMYASIQMKIDRVVLAFSSSTYGDHPDLPKVEHEIGNPLSPYAVTKASIEQFADVFGNTYNLKWIGLRYFNVFGPKQNPNNPYAAVIPIFAKAFLTDGTISINGDGHNSRDFTYVDNIIKLNELSLFVENKEALNQGYNAACGGRVSLREMVAIMQRITGKDINMTFAPERVGDVKHSMASIKKASDLLGYKPVVRFEEGLQRTMTWYNENLNNLKE